MGGIFYVVLNMSITAALVGLLVAAIRLALRRRLPAFAQYALWGLVGLRLALPLSLPSRASLFNLINRDTLVVSLEAGGTGTTMMNAVKTANAAFPIHFKSDLLEQIFNAAGWVWLAGAGLALAFIVTLYALAEARLRRASPVGDGWVPAACAERIRVRWKIRLYASNAVDSPVVFGVIRQRVVIPSSMKNDSPVLWYALLHECAHIRRGDNLLRLLSACILCLHWFNPFAWMFFMLSGRDMERACDEKVLKDLDGPERKGYALALASLASRRQPTLAAAFGGSAVRERIIRITKFRKVTFAAGVFIFLGFIILAVAVITNPVG